MGTTGGKMKTRIYTKLALVLFIALTSFNGACPPKPDPGPGPNPNSVPVESGKIAQARRVFLQMWEKRYRKCDDGYWKGRINVRLQGELFIQGRGWLAISGDPATWKIDAEAVKLTEADRLNGILWGAELIVTPKSSIAFVDNLDDVENKPWESWQNGLVAMPLAGCAGLTVFGRITEVNAAEYEKVYLTITETTDNMWYLNPHPEFEGLDKLLVQTWLLGSKPAECSEFPKLPNSK